MNERRVFMLRFIESDHGFKDGLYILFHQSFVTWIFTFILIGLIAFGIWLFIRFVREHETYGKLSLVMFGVLALFAILLIKPVTIMASEIGHYEGDLKVDKVKKVTNEGHQYYALSNKKTEVRSRYVILVPLSTVDKGKVKKGSTVNIKTHPLLQDKKQTQIFNTTGKGIDFKVK